MANLLIQLRNDDKYSMRHFGYGKYKTFSGRAIYCYSKKNVDNIRTKISNLCR